MQLSINGITVGKPGPVVISSWDRGAAEVRVDDHERPGASGVIPIRDLLGGATWTFHLATVKPQGIAEADRLIQEFTQAWDSTGLAPGDLQELTLTIPGLPPRTVYGRCRKLASYVPDILAMRGAAKFSAEFKVMDSTLYGVEQTSRVVSAAPAVSWGFYTGFTTPLMAAGSPAAIGTPALINNQGPLPVPFRARFYGPALSPRLEWETGALALSGAIPPHTWIEVDTRTGHITDNIGKPAYSFAEAGNPVRGVTLPAGDSSITLQAARAESAARADIFWRESAGRI